MGREDELMKAAQQGNIPTLERLLSKSQTPLCVLGSENERTRGRESMMCVCVLGGGGGGTNKSQGEAASLANLSP